MRKLLTEDAGLPPPGSGRTVDRRALIMGAGGIAGAILVKAASGAPVQGFPVTPDSTKVQGSPTRELGQRSSFERPRRLTFGPDFSVTPHQDLDGLLTPSDLHFERHHGGVPRIDPERYRLIVHGMVERPTTFTLQDLKRFPTVSRICFIECSGNLWRTAPEDTTPQRLCGLMSQSEWTGVSLATLFREVGLRAGASWFLAEGADAAVLTRSVPIAKAQDDAMIALGQNGEAIRPEQGYPARLLTPGWEGNTSVKWIRRIEVSDRPFMTREETARYTDPLKNGTARQFSFVMDARSIITFPAYPVVLEKGWVEIRGLAWSGRGRIQRVDVSTDGGRKWEPASLDGLVLPKAQTRFSYLWNWNGRETEIMSRAVDETGYEQPTRAALIAARGKGSVPSHVNPITAWAVSQERRGGVSIRGLGVRSGDDFGEPRGVQSCAAALSGDREALPISTPLPSPWAAPCCRIPIPPSSVSGRRRAWTGYGPKKRGRGLAVPSRGSSAPSRRTSPWCRP